jgi:hypothetical protein
MYRHLSSNERLETASDVVLGHVVGRAALIADPLTVLIHANGIELAQDAAAFPADTDYRPEAVSAEIIPHPRFGMYPVFELLGLLAEKATLHSSPSSLKIFMIIT